MSRALRRVQRPLRVIEGVSMRRTVLLSALLLSGPAWAKRTKAKIRQRVESPAAAADALAVEPAEGSLWDFIEEIEGTLPADEAVAPSEELDAERTAEAAFLQEASSVAAGPDPAEYYEDPAGVTADDPLHLRMIDPTEFDIPIVVNDDVVRWMQYFTGSGRKYYRKWLARSSKYRPMMYEKLEAAGLPKDLVYLSMIESGYATHAYSRAAAVGLWQFITPTAREWGMRVDWWVDDRRDPEMATDAAVKFLGHLNKRFGHWYLAWAAYNGGPARVDRAIRNHGTKDFYALVEKNAFPRETDNYVPKLVAAAIIGKHPERYGFTGISYQDRLSYDTVQVGPNIGIDVLARCAGMTQEAFQALNPHLRRWALPPDGKSYTLRVPKDKGRTFLAALDQVPPSERLTYRRYKVAKGDTLGKIAARHGVSVQEVTRFNRIKNANRIYVGMELVIPTAGATPPPGALASTAPGPSAKKSTKKKVTHTVRRGEALSVIASRYGVKQSDIMRWNKIRNANKVYAGQKLVIYASGTSSAWSTYTVRSGDSLGRIAQRQGCSVSDLKSWNGLRSNTIHPGQKLKVRR